VTSQQPPPPRLKRKIGGQPGNRNALKHALYSRYFPEAMKKSFITWETTDYIGEIQLLRASMDRMAAVLLVQDDIPVDQKVAMINGICRASSTLSLLVQRPRQEQDRRWHQALHRQHSNRSCRSCSKLPTSSA
jgi:hypothetical protein